LVQPLERCSLTMGLTVMVSKRHLRQEAGKKATHALPTEDVIMFVLDLL